MKLLAICIGLLLGGETLGRSQVQPAAAAPAPNRVVWSMLTNTAGLVTNGPAHFKVSYTELYDIGRNPQYDRNQKLLQSTNKLPAAFVERLLKAKEPEYLTNVMYVTNLAFQSFRPDSLNHLIWTNLLARTNGRSMQVWSRRVHPAGWPASKVSAEWNRQSLVWSLRGFTAISPCWEAEGESGQVPITALTRRHGYTRGHGMGLEGARKNFAGKRVWFLTPENKVVQVRVEREVVRTTQGRDYTILLFDDDLPATIQPLRVVNSTAFSSTYTNVAQAPSGVLLMEQHGNAATLLPGMTYPVYKGGDSGSANLLLLPDELIFLGGRSTSSPSEAIQADMDELCRLEGLDHRKYQMGWLDYSKYPRF